MGSTERGAPTDHLGLALFPGGKSVRFAGCALGVLLGLMLAACGAGSPEIDTGNNPADNNPADNNPANNTDQAGERTVVRGCGAASLTDAFQDLEVAFELKEPGYDVELNLAGSASLRAQITSGAPVDVFAAANTEVMDDVVQLGTTVDPPVIFATNQLTIAVPTDNPAGLAGLADFADDQLFLGLCATTVPCGALAEAVLADAAVTPSVDTREPDVRALLTKISAGELDGGIVYTTDVAAALGEVVGIDIPEEFARSADYPIAVLDQADAVEGGQSFVAFVLGPSGTQILAEHGFGAP